MSEIAFLLSGWCQYMLVTLHSLKQSLQQLFVEKPCLLESPLSEPFPRKSLISKPRPLAIFRPRNDFWFSWILRCVWDPTSQHGCGINLYFFWQLCFFGSRGCGPSFCLLMFLVLSMVFIDLKGCHPLVPLFSSIFHGFHRLFFPLCSLFSMVFIDFSKVFMDVPWRLSMFTCCSSMFINFSMGFIMLSMGFIG